MRKRLQRDNGSFYFFGDYNGSFYLIELFGLIIFCYLCPFLNFFQEKKKLLTFVMYPSLDLYVSSFR
ncbi:unnamed protein product [Arabidopsis halleri]